MARLTEEGVEQKGLKRVGSGKPVIGDNGSMRHWCKDWKALFSLFTLVYVLLFPWVLIADTYLDVFPEDSRGEITLCGLVIAGVLLVVSRRLRL